MATYVVGAEASSRKGILEAFDVSSPGVLSVTFPRRWRQDREVSAGGEGQAGRTPNWQCEDDSGERRAYQVCVRGSVDHEIQIAPAVWLSLIK